MLFSLDVTLMVIELPLWRRLPDWGEADCLVADAVLNIVYFELDGFEFDEFVDVVDESDKLDVLGKLLDAVAVAGDPAAEALAAGDTTGVTV